MAEFSTSEWVIKLNLIPLASVLFFCLTLFVAAAATAFRKIFIKSTWAAEWRIERDEASGAKEKGHWPRAAHWNGSQIFVWLGLVAVGKYIWNVHCVPTHSYVHWGKNCVILSPKNGWKFRAFTSQHHKFWLKIGVSYLKMLVKTFAIDWQSKLENFKFDQFLQKMMM